MSSKRCPRPPHRHYKIGTSFFGNIVSLYCAEKGLVYILNEKHLEDLGLIEKSTPAHAYINPPEFGEIFIYRNSNNMCYRAYRLRSNPADFAGVRAFLFDTGIQILQNFNPKRFFKMPVKFAVIPPMAVFCCVRSYPKNDEQELSSYLKGSLLIKKLKFNITIEMRLENALGKNRRCLEVVIEEPELNEVDESEDETFDDFCYEQKGYDADNHRSEKRYFPRLTYLEETFDKTSCSRSEELQPVVDTFPANGSKIIVFITKIISPTSMYAQVVKQNEITISKYKESKASSQLIVWMNDEHVIKSYQKLTNNPNVDDMVIAVGHYGLYYRGRVSGKSENGFKIFFIDFGYTLDIGCQALYKFPREFTTLPAQAVHLKLSNTVTLQKETNELELVETIMSILQPYGVAHVNSSSFNSFQMNLSIQMFDVNGTNLVDAVSARMKNHVVSGFDDKEADFE